MVSPHSAEDEVAGRRLTVSEPDPATSVRRPFKLGFFTHVTSNAPGAGPYDELKELFIGAEQLGFDAGFVAQHHLSNPTGGRLPSPLIGLASVAEHTKTIELGTAVSVLPLEDPIRLAEDAAVLDLISNGRLQLGLGTGTANFAGYAAFGKAVAQRHSLYDENLRILFEALSGMPLRGTNAVLSPDGRALLNRIWGTPGDADSARRAARFGTGALFGTSNLHARTQQRPIIDAYLQEWQRCGAVDAPPIARPLLTPRLGGIRMIYPTTSRDDAIAELTGYFDAIRPSVGKALALPEDAVSIEQLVDRTNLHYGSPAETAKSLLDDAALFPEVDYLIPVTVVLVSARAAGGSASREVDHALAGLEAIAQVVAPLLGWSPAARSTAHDTRRVS